MRIELPSGETLRIPAHMGTTPPEEVCWIFAYYLFGIRSPFGNYQVSSLGPQGIPTCQGRAVGPLRLLIETCHGQPIRSIAFEAVERFPPHQLPRGKQLPSRSERNKAMLPEG